MSMPAQYLLGCAARQAARRTALVPRYLIGWLLLGLAVARERRQLAAMSERDLKDIGLSRADAAREAARTCWDLPVDRLRF
jgi:uncharacterized protein YjiS (DUF1127 family)